MQISSAARLNAGIDAMSVATTTHRGDVQMFWNPGKSCVTVHVKEGQRRRISRRVRIGSADHAKLWQAMFPVVIAAAATAPAGPRDCR